jgi:hypothetical protein
VVQELYGSVHIKELLAQVGLGFMGIRALMQELYGSGHTKSCWLRWVVSRQSSWSQIEAMKPQTYTTHLV